MESAGLIHHGFQIVASDDGSPIFTVGAGGPHGFRTPRGRDVYAPTGVLGVETEHESDARFARERGYLVDLLIDGHPDVRISRRGNLVFRENETWRAAQEESAMAFLRRESGDFRAAYDAAMRRAQIERQCEADADVRLAEAAVTQARIQLREAEGALSAAREARSRQPADLRPVSPIWRDQ